MVEYDRVWQSMAEYGRVWWSMVVVEYGRVWWSVVEYGRVWWSMVEYGGVWQSIGGRVIQKSGVCASALFMCNVIIGLLPSLLYLLERCFCFEIC